jgi:hypothetical protein
MVSPLGQVTFILPPPTLNTLHVSDERKQKKESVHGPYSGIAYNINKCKHDLY